MAFTPTKLNHIPSRAKCQSAKRSSTGSTNAMETEITVALKGFSIADRKLCVETLNHLKRYAKQKSLIAFVDISKSVTSSALTNQEAIVSGKKKSSEVDIIPTHAVPIKPHRAIFLTLP